MSERYKLDGEFRIVTECADLSKIQAALVELERQFGDIIEFRTNSKGYLVFSSALDLRLNLRDPHLPDEIEADIAEHDEMDD